MRSILQSVSLFVWLGLGTAKEDGFPPWFGLLTKSVKEQTRKEQSSSVTEQTSTKITAGTFPLFLFIGIHFVSHNFYKDSFPSQTNMCLPFHPSQTNMRSYSSSSSSSSSISSCDNVARLNNEAALQIRNGDYSQATESLASALFALKATISNKVCSSNTNDADTSMTSTATQKKNKNAGFYFVSSKHPTATTTTTSDLECNDWFLHRDAIEINSYYHSWAGESDSAEVLLSYPIIYNLGLCHHLEAIDELSRRCPPSRNDDADGSLRASSYSFIQARLQRSVTLYLQAQKLLLANVGLLPNNKSDVEEVLHVMAVTNNLGHAYHFLHNDSSSKACFQRLLQTIVYISESNDAGGSGRHHQLCFDGFLSNVTKVIGNSQAASAA